MSKIKTIFRFLLPDFLIQFYRSNKKNRINRKIAFQKQRGQGLNKKDLYNCFYEIGIRPGDSLLVHSSLSKIGFVENGAVDVVDSLLEIISHEGDLLMPSSANGLLQIDFVKKDEVFDVKNTPSVLGSITENFRKRDGVRRSLNYLEPVCAYGKNARYLTEGHFGEVSPYTKRSPFHRLTELNGKILYLGVDLDNAGTSLHILEDSVDFHFPVYASSDFRVKIKDEKGVVHTVFTKAHNPVFSKKRKCNDLIPMFIDHGVCEKVKIGNAESYLFDAKKMLDLMLEKYKSEKITMYTPKG
ncbi:MAG: AAC(3) family N-acetyltransferase [Flavobacteriales bacterium]|nr:AAC(3) family N-acetyltransferase [Flavobacteriales bacterium]